MSDNRLGKVLFTIGDYVTGASAGAGTAAAVHITVNQKTDMVLAGRLAHRSGLAAPSY